MKKRILAVDDEPAITRMIKLILEQTGLYEVRTENKGARAIESARQFQPDLILLDLVMPDMLGSDIGAQLEKDPKLSAIRVVFLTALVTKDEELSSGGQISGKTFVAKPVSKDELCRVIEEHLGR
jgi:CheY-like chemotaxis protein